MIGVSRKLRFSLLLVALIGSLLLGPVNTNSHFVI